MKASDVNVLFANMPAAPNPTEERVSYLDLASTPTTMLGLLSIPPIYDSLQECMPPDTAILLSRTCKQLYNAYTRQWTVGKWSINSRLAKLVDNPNVLRWNMAHYNALISGSFAMQFFDRLTWEASDLDIFVETGDAVDALDCYLQVFDKYKLESAQDAENMDEYAMRGLVQVLPNC